MPLFAPKLMDFQMKSGIRDVRKRRGRKLAGTRFSGLGVAREKIDDE
jgi:hypothetical protein